MKYLVVYPMQFSPTSLASSKTDLRVCDNYNALYVSL